MNEKTNFIKIADILDKNGHSDLADFVDLQIQKTAKKGYHKCGLKEETVNNHVQLFDGYKKASEHFQKKQARAFKGKDKNDSPNMGELREITRGIAHNSNAVFLHDMYIQDVYECKPYSLEKSQQMQDFIKELYGSSVRSFKEDLERIAKIPRNGWVLLNFCLIEKKLYLDVIDLHEIGVQAHSTPVMCLDMWEHAYICDFGLDKEAYVQWFLSRMDWRNVAKRIKNYQRLR